MLQAIPSATRSLSIYALPGTSKPLIDIRGDNPEGGRASTNTLDPRHYRIHPAHHKIGDDQATYEQANPAQIARATPGNTRMAAQRHTYLRLLWQPCYQYTRNRPQWQGFFGAEPMNVEGAACILYPANVTPKAATSKGVEQGTDMPSFRVRPHPALA